MSEIETGCTSFSFVSPRMPLTNVSISSRVGSEMVGFEDSVPPVAPYVVLNTYFTLATSPSATDIWQLLRSRGYTNFSANPEQEGNALLNAELAGSAFKVG